MTSLAQLSSSAPTRFNNYRATSNTVLDYNVWNATVGDLALRMAAVEQKATGYDALVAAGIGIALTRINDALEPAFAQVSSILVQTNTYLEQLQGNTLAATLIVTSPTERFVTDAQIAEIAEIPSLDARISALEARAAKTSARAFYLSTM
jgi:hypothetical protein